MTSKEALENSKDNLTSNGEIFEYTKEYKAIKRDLEVLELLKQLLKGSITLQNNEVDISHYVAILSESTNKQLKEWLEKMKENKDKETTLNEKDFIVKKDNYNLKQDEALTYEELTVLCKKQEEQIEELEKKIVCLLNEDGKLEAIAKPTYEEYALENERQSDRIIKNEDTISALIESLRLMKIELNKAIERAEYFEEQYTKENRRANKLYDELHQEKL